MRHKRKSERLDLQGGERRCLVSTVGSAEILRARHTLSLSPAFHQAVTSAHLVAVFRQAVRIQVQTFLGRKSEDHFHSEADGGVARFEASRSEC